MGHFLEGVSDGPRFSVVQVLRIPMSLVRSDMALVLV
jgi:hypothetical protein